MARAKKEEVEKTSTWFSTGSTLLDLIVGGGDNLPKCGMGFEAGTIVRDWGGNSSTKSFKLSECIAHNRYKFKDNFRWAYRDLENGNKLDSMGLYGFDLFKDGVQPYRPILTVQDFDYDLNTFLDDMKPGQCGIYGLDSLDFLSNQEIEELKEKRRSALDKDKEFDDKTYGADLQKFMSQQLFRGLTQKLLEKNCILYVLSQERENFNAGPYGRKVRVNGGTALKHAESVRIYSRQRQIEEKNGVAYASVIEVIGEKTRHPRPYGKCFVTVNYRYGTDDISDCIDYLFDLRSSETGKLLKRADSIIWEDGEEPRTKEEMVSFIETNKLKKELRRRVIDKWEINYADIEKKRPSKFEEDNEE